MLGADTGRCYISANRRHRVSHAAFDKIIAALAEHGAKPLPAIENHGVGALKEPSVQREA
jgi:hypothetical protein